MFSFRSIVNSGDAKYWCTGASSLEGRSLRWKPFGMPRLNPSFEQAVFFLYGTDPETGKRVGPNGTGVLIGLPATTGGWYLTHFYALTCQHVAPPGNSIIRINTKDGKSRLIETHPDDWQWIPGHDDLAALDVTDWLDIERDSYSAIPSHLLVTKEFVARDEVEIGEDGFMLGLFADLPGKIRNLVAARFGNISLLADDETPIVQPNKSRRPSHLFDMRSRPGFSGSPVFVYRTPGGDLRYATERGRDKAFRRYSRRSQYSFVGPGGDFGYEVIDHSPMHDMQDDHETADNTFLMLLGIHAGQYYDRVKAFKGGGAPGESDNVVRDGDEMRIPNSMAIVVPSWEILTLLNEPTFAEQRQKREEIMAKKKNEAEPEAIDSVSESTSSSPPATDANPTHREDFMRLVGAAARKPAQED
jgi:hypothetical protein